ncbi:TetR/AcrR family transcriptional regulator [Gordonia neofelifaecis]|uniref:Regulatory protein TetR n=1 Tax=Gordonia neofelifaecis NRRL B-59395 TaxID=644548 RepID=F1YNZ8_9ACTN|nr:TetR family transcriptional regulator [Gordonia neofelifaecis]EGD53617.1 regulatory protein TetR [Gordonia neofelifaecis NRRL B-59395]
MMARLTVEQRRDAAISATMRVIARDGVEAATTRRIALEAQVGQSSLFYAFASRDELLAAVVEHGIAQELAGMDEWLSQASAMFTASQMNISDVMRAAFGVFMHDLIENRDREHALVELALYAQRTQGLEHLAERLYRGYYELVSGLLTVAQESTGVRWSLPVEELATIVVAMTDGMTLSYLSTGDRDVVQRIADGGVQLLLGYVEH